MSDLISRQAAIAALNEYFARIEKLKRRGLTKGKKAISLDTVGAIKTLPPANCSEFPNNSDAISRQAAIEVVQNRHMMLSKEKVLLINDLEKLPSAEPQRIRGRWIDKGVCTYVDNCRHLYKCDQCGGGWLDTPDFCPNCGAKMKGEHDE